MRLVNFYNGGIAMNFITSLQRNSQINNSKGGKYYYSTYNSNLDLYAGLSRFNDEDEIINKFHNAYNEDRCLALANLLFILDIKDGKGERRIFKILFKELCKMSPDDARIVLAYIGTLGRYDYILEGLHTEIEDDVIELIRDTLKKDLIAEHPTLLAKWLPSHRTHNKPSKIAKYIINKLNISEKDYRIILSRLRTKINIVEKNITNKTYENINFEEVPAKAMLKYDYVFNTKVSDKFNDYKKMLKNGNTKINTNGLFCYEIIQKINYNVDRTILNAMWENQKNIETGANNILVVADTSGSMMCYGGIPYASSVGLAIYTAQRNKGIFKDKFITFSENPILQEVKGLDIVDKFNSIKTIVANTNIDKVFELILKSMKDAQSNISDLPSHIVIISDMEFDCGIYSKNGTNFEGWKKAFKEEGYELPKIIFWNVAGCTNGVPAIKNDNDCVMVSGFSTNLLENIFNLEEFSPLNQMYTALEKYLNLIKIKE